MIACPNQARAKQGWRSGGVVRLRPKRGVEMSAFAPLVGAKRTLRSAPSTYECTPYLRFRRLDDGIVALGIEADQVPRLPHVRRQRRGDIDHSPARVRHDDATGQEVQAVLHAAGQLPVFLGKILRVTDDGMP